MTTPAIPGKTLVYRRIYPRMLEMNQKFAISGWVLSSTIFVTSDEAMANFVDMQSCQKVCVIRIKQGTTLGQVKCCLWAGYCITRPGSSLSLTFTARTTLQSGSQEKVVVTGMWGPALVHFCLAHKILLGSWPGWRRRFTLSVDSQSLTERCAAVPSPWNWAGLNLGLLELSLLVGGSRRTLHLIG